MSGLAVPSPICVAALRLAIRLLGSKKGFLTGTIDANTSSRAPTCGAPFSRASARRIEGRIRG
jgi:hypothetical protein